MDVQIAYEDLYELASLAYRQWAEAFDTLKRVKAEKDDGSDDWAEFHQARLANATTAEEKWKGLKDRCVKVLNLNTR